MPRPALFLRHVALRVQDLEAVERFYVDVLDMRVEWRPDPENVYLSGGTDNLAIHRVAQVEGEGALDHLGFAVRQADDVDAWAARLRDAGFPPEAGPKTHRDGARSLYVRDPAGNLIQIIHHLPIAPTL